MTWEDNLKRLRDSLHESHQCVTDDLFYRVIHIQTDTPNQGYADLLTSLSQSCNDSPQSQFIVELCNTGNVTLQYHEMYPESFSRPEEKVAEKISQAFYRCIRDVPRIFENIPSRQFSNVTFPAARGDKPEKVNLIQWTQFLMWVFQQAEPPTCGYVIKMQYANDIAPLTNLDFADWDQCLMSREFNPIELFGWKSKPRKDQNRSRDNHLHNKSLPPVFSVSFSKPLFYASMQGINCFLNNLAHRRTRSRKPQRRTLGLRPGDFNDRDLQVLNILDQHHNRPVDDRSAKDQADPKFIPLTQEEICKRSNLTQSAVSRAMQQIVRAIGSRALSNSTDPQLLNNGKVKAMAVYRKLCEGHLIGDQIREFHLRLDKTNSAKEASGDVSHIGKTDPDLEKLQNS